MDINKNTKVALERFARHIVSRARANLTRGDNNVSKKLYDSIGWNVETHPNSITLKILMDDYALFMDSGVRGANPSLVKNGKQKAPLSPFRFKDKMPPLKPIMEWAKKRNIRLRNEKGQFAKGNYKTIGFILQKRIYAQGIKPTMFFTKPYVKAFENLPEEIIEAFDLDIQELLKHITDEN